MNGCAVAATRRVVLAAGALLPAVGAFAEPVSVSAKCNIYGAGHAVPPYMCWDGGVLPVMVVVPALPGLIVEVVNVSGTVAYWPGGPTNDGDGADIQTDAPPLQGISGISCSRGRFFEGVFLTDAEPVDPAPTALSFADVSFLDLRPEIAQHFYIGDGLNGNGTGRRQRFWVPPNATRLFLGFTDYIDAGCLGAWGDNQGFIEAEIRFACAADFDQDGFVTGLDFDLYVAAFEAGEEVADFDGDTFVTGVDFDLYVQAFEQGC